MRESLDDDIERIASESSSEDVLRIVRVSSSDSLGLQSPLRSSLASSTSNATRSSSHQPPVEALGKPRPLRTLQPAATYYSDSDATRVPVRGPGYASTGRKSKSDPALYAFLGMDLVQSRGLIKRVADRQMGGPLAACPLAPSHHLCQARAHGPPSCPP